MSPRLLLPLIAAITAFAVYLPTLGNGMVIDDDDLLTADLSLYELVFEPEELDSPYYRPLTVSTYVALHVFDEGDARVRAAHVENLLLYAGSTLAVFWLCIALLPGRRYAWAGAFAASMLFALHPIHTETVAWITGRPDMIVLLFITGALYAYERYRRGGSQMWLAACAVLSFASPLAKEVGIVVFPLLAAYEWLRPGPPEEERAGGAPGQGFGGGLRAWASDRREYLVPAAVALGLALASYLVLRLVTFGSLGDSGLAWNTLRPAELSGAAGFYAEKLFVPRRLLAYYAVIPTSVPAIAAGVLVACAWVAGLVWAVRGGRRAPAFGLVWAALTLVPSMPLFVAEPSIAPIAERYLYLPSAGVAIVVAWAIREALPRLERAASKPGEAVSPEGALAYTSLAGVFAAVVVVFTVLTVVRLPDWKDVETFWTVASRDNPTAGIPHAGLGAIYRDAGLTEDAKEQFQLAVEGDIDRRRRALAWSDLGALYSDEADYRAAVDALEEAIALEPELGSARFNLALTYWRQAGESVPKDPASLALALEHARVASQLEKDRPDNLMLLALVATDAGGYDEAEAALNRIIELDPPGDWTERARRQLQLIQALR